MEGGSLADILHTAQATGSQPLSELVIGKVATRVLASLHYLHRERHQVCLGRRACLLQGERGAI